MSNNQKVHWEAVCEFEDLHANVGVRALVGDQQIAIFKVKEECFAISAIDPFTGTAVLSRGIVGDLQGKVVVASPIYKQHFELETGKCLEDESVVVKTFPVRVENGAVELCA